MGIAKLTTGLILFIASLAVFQHSVVAQNANGQTLGKTVHSGDLSSDVSSRITRHTPVKAKKLTPLKGNSDEFSVSTILTDQISNPTRSGVQNSLSDQPQAQSCLVKLGDQAPATANHQPPQMNLAGAKANFSDQAVTFNSTGQSPVAHAHQSREPLAKSSRRSYSGSPTVQNRGVSNSFSDQNQPAGTSRAATIGTPRAISNAGPSQPTNGISQNFSSPPQPRAGYSAPPTGQGYRANNQADSVGDRLNVNDIRGAKFADPKSFLKEHSFNYVDPDLFLKVTKKLKKSTPTKKKSASKKKTPPPARYASTENKFPRWQNVSDTTSNDEDNQRLTVRDVHDPISFNPFAELEQVDSSGILQEQSPMGQAIVPAGTYSEMTGQYFQPHHATWAAHHFHHRPLYFEETNLERYGNQLRYQNLMSTAHFFTSAALIPYKMGQTPPSSCISTLGHHRPGQCVPYQVHRGERSRKGLFWQAFTITAMSL